MTQCWLQGGTFWVLWWNAPNEAKDQDPYKRRSEQSAHTSKLSCHQFTAKHSLLLIYTLWCSRSDLVTSGNYDVTHDKKCLLQRSMRGLKCRNNILLWDLFIILLLWEGIIIWEARWRSWTVVFSWSLNHFVVDNQIPWPKHVVCIAGMS